MAIQAGNLRHRVQLQAPSFGDPDKLGNRTETFTTVATVWAALKPLSGREVERAKTAGVATASHTLQMRYRKDVSVKCRILFSGRTFLINGIQNERELNAELNLTLTELVT